MRLMSLVPVQRPRPVAGPLDRPQYDNTRVHSFALWAEDNHRALIAWWFKCDTWLRDQGAQPGDPSEFPIFCECQHEREARKAMQ